MDMKMQNGKVFWNGKKIKMKQVLEDGFKKETRKQSLKKVEGEVCLWNGKSAWLTSY